MSIRGAVGWVGDHALIPSSGLGSGRPDEENKKKGVRVSRPSEGVESYAYSVHVAYL